ncbi:hypothetical protein AMTR_s00081p00145720 [Amborella trichopoda]|uniref:Dynein light chain n=1 Tax=Amborella trichopoda TaxID=13333 RepID=W1P3R9_AMBTC|nr:hypothetical protein AMTR_s00081p00145720 [Amborella trichopoda]
MDGSTRRRRGSRTLLNFIIGAPEYSNKGGQKQSKDDVRSMFDQPKHHVQAINTSIDHPRDHVKAMNTSMNVGVAVSVPKNNTEEEKAKPALKSLGKMKSFENPNIKNRERIVVVESRKSVSEVDMNVASVAAFVGAKVRVADMPAFMQVHAFRCARSTYDSLEKFNPKHMAYNMKKEFDKAYGPAWHCIVGTSFGSYMDVNQWWRQWRYPDSRLRAL